MLAKTRQGIILVGGLGASPYLYDHLKAKYANAQISVLQSGGMKPYVAFQETHTKLDIWLIELLVGLRSVVAQSSRVSSMVYPTGISVHQTVVSWNQGS